MRRVTRYLTTTAAFLCLVLLSVYLALPWLAGALAPRLAPLFGLDALALEVNRPSLDVIEIESLQVRKNGISVVASTGTLTYDLLELLGGKLESLQFASVAITIEPAAEPDTIAAAPTIPRPQALFAALPITTATIDTLTLALPQLDFVASGSLRLDPGKLSFTLQGLQPMQAEQFSVEGTLSATGDLHARFLDAAIEQEFLVVDSTVTAARLVIDGRINLSGYALQLASELARVPSGTGALRAETHAELPWPVSDSALVDVTLTGSFDLNWRDRENRVRLREIRGRFSAQSDSAAVVLQGGTVELVESTLSLEIPADYQLNYADEVLTLAAGLTFELARADVSVQGQLRSLEVSAGDPAVIDLDTDFSLSGFALATSGRAKVRAEVDAAGERLTGTGSLLLGGIDLPFAFDHDIAEGRGRFSCDEQITLAAPLLANIFDSWTESYDLTSGRLGVAMDLAWSADGPAEGSIVVALTEMAGVYDEYRIDGVTGNLILRLTQDGIALNPSLLSIRQADIGIAVTDISLVARWQAPMLTITDVEMQLLGGQATFSPLSVELDQPTIAFDVALKELDLAEILALEGEDIAGSGVLNGLLPLRFSAGKVTMTDGRLTAEPPGGDIRLSPSLSRVTGQPGLDFALQALTNFSYSSLETVAQYAENGDLDLAVSLQGTNPEVENGRPILYNLNIHENVPVLLESLRVQDAIINRLERRVLK